MKLTLSCLLTVLTVQILFPGTGNAQSSKTSILQAPPAKIVIDGDAEEWGDSLHYYNAEKMINYDIANSKDTLYLAVRVNDRSQQMRILRAGLTIGIDPKGKKKETFSVTFPLTVAGSAAPQEPKPDGPPGDVTDQDREELMRQRLTSLRGIKVEGFKDIEGDMITTSNTYGFKTAVNYDKNGYLICEAAIPMSFFHADAETKNEWAFNFKINGIQRKAPTDGNDQQGQGGGGKGGHGGGMGGMGGGGMGGGRGGHGGRGGMGGNPSQNGGEGNNTLSKSEDFWEKYYLAK